MNIKKNLILIFSVLILSEVLIILLWAFVIFIIISLTFLYIFIL